VDVSSYILQKMDEFTICLVNFWIDNFGRLKHSLFNALTNQTFFIEFLPDFERDFRTIIGQAC